VELDDAIAVYMMGFGYPGRRLKDNAPLSWKWRKGLGNYMACTCGSLASGAAPQMHAVYARVASVHMRCSGVAWRGMA
jgi:hypothetical protein